MKTSPIAPKDLAESVLAVPPLARTGRLELAPSENQKMIAHLEAGGVRTIVYGGNANLYNIGMVAFSTLIEALPSWASDDTWLVPSIGPSFGIALEQADLCRDVGYPTVMLLPASSLTTPDGVATAVRKIAERFAAPIILYLKRESYLSVHLLGRLVDDGLVCGIKYAVVRDDPSRDSLLSSILDRVDSSIVISGIGERPSIVHLRDFGLSSFTSGSVCLAPGLSMQLLQAIRQHEFGASEEIRARFLPLEDLRDSIHPIRVLHDAVTLAGIADMGPVLPTLSNLDGAARQAVSRAASALASADTTVAP